ncbi:MAG: methyltransferase domain-containing protein [Candidatus Eisenbacteria bacterium]|nr:methyltransferase domain-containing protein [Candidatus Eisenbacteria bacterium]
MESHDPRASSHLIRMEALARVWHGLEAILRCEQAPRGPDGEQAHCRPECERASSPNESPPLPDAAANAWERLHWKLLDVQPEPAFLEGHLPGAAHIARGELSARSHELPPKERTLIVCAEDPDGARAAAADLRARGWLASRALADPLAGWPGPWETGPSRARLWEPSPLVRCWADAIAPGPILDLGCGAGRDAVFLALRGHAVVAIDRLPDALEKARDLSARHAVSLDLRLSDLRKDAVPGSEYAAVLSIRYFSGALLDAIARVLRPGGLWLLEAYPHAAAPQNILRLISDRQDWKLRFHEEGQDDTRQSMTRLVLERE